MPASHRNALQRTAILDGTRLFQRLVSALFVDRLKTARRDADTHKFLELWHPNPLATQIWRKNARHHFRHVPAYTAFFLGQATPVNDAAAHDFGSCNIANS